MLTPSQDKLNVIINWLMEYSNEPNVKFLLNQINVRDNELFTNQEFQNLKPRIKEFLKTSNWFNRLGNDDYYELSLEGKKIVENGGYLHYLEQTELKTKEADEIKRKIDRGTIFGFKVNILTMLFGGLTLVVTIIGLLNVKSDDIKNNDGLNTSKESKSKIDSTQSKILKKEELPKVNNKILEDSSKK